LLVLTSENKGVDLRKWYHFHQRNFNSTFDTTKKMKATIFFHHDENCEGAFYHKPQEQQMG